MLQPAVVRATELLEASLFTPESLASALEAVGREIGFDHFALVHSDLENLTFIASEPAVEAFNAYDRGGWREVDYRAANVNQTPAGRLFLDHIVVPKAERISSAIYNELYVPMRMAYFAGWRFDVADATWIYSLARAEDKGPASAADIDALTALAPFANRALLTAWRMRDAHVAGMVDGLASAGVAALVIDNNGRVSLATPQAEAMFGSELGIRAGRLWAANPHANREIEKLIMLARVGAANLLVPDLVIRRAHGRKPLLLQPIPVRGVGLDALPGARILLMLTDLEASTMTNAATLEHLFDLSQAEAQVAALLGQGLEPAEIARRRNVSVDTVRGQLKSIFRKTGASRQSDVVSLIARLPSRANNTDDPGTEL